MNFLKKVAVYSSVLLCTACWTPFYTQANATTAKEIAELGLESKAPSYFRGFHHVDDASMETLRNPKNVFKSNAQLRGQFQSLQEELKSVEKPGVEKIRVDLERVIQDEKYSYFWYAVFAARSLILVSEQTEEELNFFRAAGFSMPYSLISYNLEQGDWIEGLAKVKEERNHQEDFDFEDNFYKQYRDPHDVLDAQLFGNPNNGFPFLVPCEKEKDDIFGFFFLAWTYHQGIHPVPVSLKPTSGEIHGIKMSPWGKFCHDLAHHRIDPAERSIEGFTDLVLNHYATELRSHFGGLGAEEKKKSGIGRLIRPTTDFAIEVHKAYSKAMTSLLDQALENMDAKYGEMTDEFKAFSSGAFIQAHEQPNNLSRYLGSPQLDVLLEKAAELPEALRKKTSKDSNSPEIKKEGDQEVVAIVQPTISEPAEKNVLSAIEEKIDVNAEKVEVYSNNEVKEEGLESVKTDNAPASTGGDVQEVVDTTQPQPQSTTAQPTEKKVLQPIEELIPTSYVTGESNLTDDEIIEIIKQRPRSEFLPRNIFDSSNLEEKMIVDATVKRNKFFIQVSIEMFDGAIVHYRILTKYSDCLNLHHDRQMLLPATKILASKYGYTLPKVPAREAFSVDDNKYEEAVIECRKKLDEGRAHVVENFYETVKQLAHERRGDRPTIAEAYEASYKESLSKLRLEFPTIVEDLQEFINKAVQEVK